MRGSFTLPHSPLFCRPSHFCNPRVSALRTQSLKRSLVLGPGLKLTGESGRIYRLICPLGHRELDNAPNVWKAVNHADESEQVVVKGPSSDDDRSLSWPLFQHELEMQKLFTGSPLIRQMIDYIPSFAGEGPKIVLQGFEKTLWTARERRPMTSNEIKWIMKAVILGLWTVHREGFVYSGESLSAQLRYALTCCRFEDGKCRAKWVW